jgi:hypothetical protein
MRTQTQTGEPPHRKLSGKAIRPCSLRFLFFREGSFSGRSPTRSLALSGSVYFTSTFRRIQGWMQH